MSTFRSTLTPIQEAERLTHPHKILHPDIFDSHNEMYPVIRQKILRKVDFLFNKGLNKIAGLKLKDVILVGSCANYLYKEKSDFDVYGVVENQSSPLFPKSGKPLNRALGAIGRSNLDHRAKFYCLNRFCDIRFINDYSYIISGIYSIKNNQWIREPSQELTSKFSATEVVDNFIKKCQEIDDFYDSFQLKNGKFTYEECQKMSDYYVSLFNEDKSNPDNFIIFKMLDTQGVIKRIGSFVATAYIKSLSY